ncbi:MAG: GHMP kinase [Fibrobacteres bacterium]|nr:GHMP kinase [Fibrobacterota bacterium]
MIIREKAYARAGLIGNPSDGYFGKTISFRIKNFCAEVTLYETPEIEILPTERDHCTYSDINALVHDINRFDYYGGVRLIKAAIKRFADYCREKKVPLPKKNFTVRYNSNIPQHVGMAGSSAIITATFLSLMKFYDVKIDKEILPNLILSVETVELKLAAGLQDRVIQVYGGLVYMDFNRELMTATGHGRYESLPLDRLPKLYVAYRQDLAEVSDVVHSNLRSRFDSGDPVIHNAMKFFASITDQAKAVLLGTSDLDLGTLMNSNFDKRCEIMHISEPNMKMVQLARSTGATAKFTGSGGAIVGTYKNEEMFDNLSDILNKENIAIFKPEII